MRYFPQKIEEKWRKWWLKNRTYEPDFSSRSANRRKPFYNLMMFPYPSAEGLHIGSVRTFSGIDIYGRLKRMQGYDLFEPIGLDGFGIHSENYALKVGKHPFRHAKDSEKNFYRQLGTIGNGFAWEERLETYNPLYYKWTQWIFVQMFKRGLAYRKKSPVNWCPSCKTVLADEQVLHGECERCQSKVVKKDLEQWFFRITKYADRLLKNLDNLSDRQAGIDWPEPIKIAQRNWIGKSEGALITFPIKNHYNYIFLHGYKGNPQSDFWPWLKKELEKQGAKIYAPKLPDPGNPNIGEQIKYVLNNYQFDKDTVVVSHSLGGVLALKLLPELKTKIAGLVMVAPPLRTEFLDGKDRPSLKKATDWKFDFEKVKEKADWITVIKDIHDKIVPPSHPEEIAKKLNARLVEVIANKSHFNSQKEPVILNEVVSSIEVFTTRPDTLFGTTYMVVGPEHRLIKNQESRIKNQEEIKKYIEATEKKTNDERIAEGREKTGVELKGVKAINPANGEEIPVWVADYVLGNVGTGAIMAVPAHDQRDFEFAKKYKLPIEQVIAPYFSAKEGKDAIRNGKKTIKRRTAYAFLWDRKNNRYLCLDWEKFGWHSGIIGGVENNEDYIEAAKREISEETGYKNIKFVKYLGGEVHNHFFATHKDVNRYAIGQGMLFELVNDKKIDISPENLKNHKPVWIESGKMKDWLNLSNFQYMWQILESGKECYADHGITINSGKFDGLDSEKAKWEITKFVGGQRKVNYRLRDWLISRQRYWGPPIPLVFCENCSERIKNQESRIKRTYSKGELENPGWIAVPEKNLPVKLPYIKNFRPTGTEKSPLALVEKFYKIRCPKCGSGARRETDVSDTFLDSAWYYLRYPSVRMKNSKIKMKNGNAKSEISEIPWNREITQKWLPVDMYIGGAEHAVLHLLYVRFLAMAFYDWKLIHFEEPFKKFRTHGLITKDGAKMSKSKGNIVNPDEYINAYGSDAIRMYLAFLAPLPQGGDFRDEGIKGVTRFLERVWRFFEETKDEGRKTKALVVSRSSLVRLIHKTIKKVTEDLESFQYNTAISALMMLLNFFEENQDAVTKEDVKIFLKLLAPLAPHISEELWQQIANRKSQIANSKYQSIHLESWPKYNPKLIEEETFELVIQVNGKVRGKIILPRGTSEEEAKKEALKKKEILRYLPQGPKKTIFVQNKLINFVA